MKMNLKKPSTVEEYKLVTRFEGLRSKLSEPQFAERLGKPLAFWALASDRRLPLAFLGLSLRELLNTPFAELLATPGIGRKKLGSLLTLLERATLDQPPGAAPGKPTESVPPALASPTALAMRFDPDQVSEALWVEWRAAARRYGACHVKLGRLAPTLQALPTVIWNRPLGDYTELTLAEIRQLKTHGEKRVRAVLEVFALVYQSVTSVRQAFSGTVAEQYLNLRLEPKFVLPVEQWLSAALASPAAPALDELRTKLAQPMLDQVHVDLGDTVARLAAGRLGLSGSSPQSVRTQAEKLHVTRARVYQLLEDCAKVMNVRWPEGEWMFAALEKKLRPEIRQFDAVRLVSGLRELFYPRAELEAAQLAATADELPSPAVLA